MICRTALVFLSMLLIHTAMATEFFVATDGKDTNAGTKASPFATIQRAQDAASPGDSVFVRGGTYVMEEKDIAKKQRIWACVTYLDKSGEKGKPITYAAYEKE